MIDSLLGNVFLVCDICGEECAEVFDDFYEAVEYKRNKLHGWRSVKDAAGDWQDVCPECAKELLL